MIIIRGIIITIITQKDLRMNDRFLDYNRITSLTAGTLITCAGLTFGLKLGVIPSFFGSLLGLSGLVDFACGVAGVAGGFGLYLIASNLVSTYTYLFIQKIFYFMPSFGSTCVSTNVRGNRRSHP